MESAGRQRRADAAAAVGQHEHEESQVSGRTVCRRAHRQGYGRHDSRGHVRRFPRSRPRPAQLDRKRRRSCQSHGFAREGRHFHEGSHGKARRGRCETFRRCVQAVAGGDRQNRWRACVSLNSQRYMLPEKVESLVKASLEDWKQNDKVRRLWQRDASGWTGSYESQWLGWLDITATQLAQIEQFKKVAGDVKKAKFKHALLLGMGGAGLFPEVLRMTFAKIKVFPVLPFFDSTHPPHIKTSQPPAPPNAPTCTV